MKELKLITCIVQRGQSDVVINAALDAGAQGATVFYGKGTGVRQKLGIAGKFIIPDKEIILIATTENRMESVFETIVEAAGLRKKGQGFAFVHSIYKAVGFMEEED